jgi:hypothetical protein
MLHSAKSETGMYMVFSYVTFIVHKSTVGSLKADYCELIL